MFAAAAFLRFFRLDALPLGFHHDEGLDAVSALEIWTKGQHPIFFPQQGSREPLMIYLESFGILALGATRLGARVMQACVGTAGVVAAWLLFRHMFSRRIALLATGFMALSFWQMFESRLGLRAISQPLFQTLCLLFLWRTLTSRRWLDAALAGLFLGLTMYTYTASRALPILMVVIVLWQLATSPSFLPKQWSRMALVAALGAIVFAPLGAYAVQHPDDFFGRSLQVSVVSPEPYSGADQSGGVLGAELRTLGMFSFQGDPAWKYNIGGQPVFDWPVSLLFYAGVVLSVIAVVRYVMRPRRKRAMASPHAVALWWLIVMLLPGALSSEAPHFLRTIGIIPALFVFPALALDWLLALWRWALPLAGMLLVGEGVETYQRYFSEWATSPAAYYAMHADAADVAAFLAKQPGQAPVLFSSEYPGHPTLHFLAPNVFDRIRWFNGRQSLAFAPPGQPTLYVFTALYQPPFADLAQLFQPEQLVAEGHDPAGQVAYRVYRSDTPPALAPPRPLQADLAGLARLDGVKAPDTVVAGDMLDVQEYWHTLKPGSSDLRAFLHVVDAQGHVWAQATGIGFYAEDWQPGDSTVNDQQTRLPAYAPPLPMKLQFGLFLASTGQQLPLRDSSGAPLGTELPLGAVQVQPARSPEPGWSPPHALDRELASGLTLAGYDLPSTTVRAGEALEVSLFWRVTGALSDIPRLALGDVGSQPTSSVQATAAPGTASSAPIAEADGPREAGLSDLLPPAQWPVGVIEDRRELTVPADAHAGTQVLTIGGTKLADIAVSEPSREFALPAIQHPLSVPVGDFASLAGYDLSPIRAGQPLHLTLVWQDRARVATSYKVFVHVLDATNHVIAQKDDLPQAGAMPTTLWLPGQVVSDTYDVPLPVSLPPGVQLEVGLYDSASGRRVTMGADDRLLLPLTPSA